MRLKIHIKSASIPRECHTIDILMQIMTDVKILTLYQYCKTCEASNRCTIQRVQTSLTKVLLWIS